MSFLILVPAIILAAYAQYKVSSAFKQYSQVTSMKGLSGAEVARILLDNAGLYNVPVEVVEGNLTDHYDPTSRIMRLSKEVYYSNSVASIGVAAHETGHAIQHKESYAPLNIRNSIFPVVNFSSSASWVIFFIGMLMRSGLLISIGIILFTAVVAFQIVTLPVEFDASRRALNLLESSDILYSDEVVKAKAVLDAAALTYVAAAIMSIAQLLRLLYISGDERRR